MNFTRFWFCSDCKTKQKQPHKKPKCEKCGCKFIEPTEWKPITKKCVRIKISQ